MSETFILFDGSNTIYLSFVYPKHTPLGRLSYDLSGHNSWSSDFMGFEGYHISNMPSSTLSDISNGKPHTYDLRLFDDSNEIATFHIDFITGLITLVSGDILLEDNYILKETPNSIIPTSPLNTSNTTGSNIIDSTALISHVSNINNNLSNLTISNYSIGLMLSLAILINIITKFFKR